MIEKKLIEILDPVVEEIVKLEKRLEALQRTPGPAGEKGDPGKDGVSPPVEDVAAVIKSDDTFIARLKGEPGKDGADGAPGKDGADGVSPSVDDVAAQIKADGDFCERLRGLPGKDGEPGRDGADADPEAVAAALKADDDFLAKVRGEKGEPGLPGEKGDPGEPGAPGRDGADADVEAVAKALMRDEEFVKSVINRAEEVPWHPGIWREGKCVSAYNGRSYKAVCDTTEEPGDSPHWKRIGTWGSRDVGGYDEKRAWEPGDVYHKDGSTFWFDGASHRLMLAKPFTERDFEKQLKSERAANRETLKALIESNKELRAHADGLQAEVEALKQVIEDLVEKIKKVTK